MTALSFLNLTADAIVDIQWSSLTHQSQLAIKEISEGNDMPCQVKMTDLVSVIDFLLDVLNWKIHDKKNRQARYWSNYG